MTEMTTRQTQPEPAFVGSRGVGVIGRGGEPLPELLNARLTPRGTLTLFLSLNGATFTRRISYTREGAGIMYYSVLETPDGLGGWDDHGWEIGFARSMKDRRGKWWEPGFAARVPDFDALRSVANLHAEAKEARDRAPEFAQEGVQPSPVTKEAGATA